MSDVLTVEKLKEVMALIPQPIGYALLVPNSQIDSGYKILRNTGGMSDFMPGKALYWLVVPSSFLNRAINSLRAVPSDEIDGEAYRFDVFSLLKDDIG